MPFKSKAQQRFMYATHPKGVDLKEWAESTDFKHLPEKKKEAALDALIARCLASPQEKVASIEYPALEYFKLAHKLTGEERKHISKGNFALPGRRYPIEDENHARNALARASGKSVEGAVRAAVHSKYPGIGKE
jgi:hypothetical protein